MTAKIIRLEPRRSDPEQLVRLQPCRWALATVSCVLAMREDVAASAVEWMAILDEVDAAVRPILRRAGAR
jgi:hypothetical protein